MNDHSKLVGAKPKGELKPLTGQDQSPSDPAKLLEKMKEISNLIQDGAITFLT
jgi:hypothetical protein